MNAAGVKVHVTLAWWFDVYLYGLVCFCWVFGAVPDPAKIEKVVYRAIRIRLKKE